MDSLVNKLIDVAERSDLVGSTVTFVADLKDVFSHIRAIWLLCRTQPDLVNTGKASVLLTYLHHPAANVSRHLAFIS